MELNMIEVDPEPQSHAENYKIMTGLVVPRPIAWISTLSPEGRVNLAPYSSFTFVSHKPPMITITAGLREDEEFKGQYKDTIDNIFRNREFVVNIADHSLLGPLHASSAAYPPGRSEVEALGLETHPSTKIATPRLARAPAALECRFHSSFELGDVGDRIVIGQVVMFQIADRIFRNGKIQTMELNPVARIAGPNYALLSEIITMPSAQVVPLIE
jgi:flavin reductase (DIM6/NTAB) family NADH-FMN oxidoreductase RutF